MKKDIEKIVLEGTIVNNQVRTTYSSNNSGGDWWLSDKDWHALEDAGWEVNWVKDDPHYNGKDRWLGALATSASRNFPLELAKSEWSTIVGMSPNDSGCSCCGQPHYFSED